jgi:hypothetical protein
VNALPSYFDWYNLCHIPQRGYKNHGTPLKNEHITFTLEDSTGALSTSWKPGETYTLSTLSGNDEEVHAFVHASSGVLDADKMNSKTGFQSSNCENAWGSMAAARRHEMQWVAPSNVPSGGLCVLFSAAQASSGKAAYQTNSVCCRLCSWQWSLQLQCSMP